MTNKKESILLGAGPFFFEGNKIGILLIHGGGGGTCADLEPLARQLHDIGNYTVSVPLLPGFGRSPEILRETPIEEWKNEINNQIDRLQQKCDTIFMGGHSMGGILTVITAKKHDFNGIFLISTPIDFGSKIISYLGPVFSLFVKYHATGHDHLKKDTAGKWVGYEKIPTNIVIKVKKLLKEMKNTLPDIKTPILILQGRNDKVIKRDSMEYIFNNLGSRDKEMKWLGKNDHAILDSPDYNLILKNIEEFIKKYTGKN